MCCLPKPARDSAFPLKDFFLPFLGFLYRVVVPTTRCSCRIDSRRCRCSPFISRARNNDGYDDCPVRARSLYWNPPLRVARYSLQCTYTQRSPHPPQTIIIRRSYRTNSAPNSQAQSTRGKSSFPSGSLLLCFSTSEGICLPDIDTALDQSTLEKSLVHARLNVGDINASRKFSVSSSSLSTRTFHL